MNTSKLNSLNANNQTIKFIPNPEIPAPPSASALHQFKNAAVCSDSVICSKIGRLVNEQFSEEISRDYLNFIPVKRSPILLMNGLII